MSIRVYAVFIVVFIAVNLSSCVLEPVPLDDLMCPCGVGWTCFESRCVQGTSVCGRDGGENGTVEISNLRIDWVTPNQARVAWDVGDDSTLFGYEIDVAESEVALLDGSTIRLVTADENPELAHNFLPGANGRDEVNQTTIRSLDPGQAHFFRLIAYDDMRRVSCTNIAVTRTWPVARESATLFREQHPFGVGGATLPECVELRESARESQAGDFHYVFHVDCRETVAVCPCRSAADCTGLGESCEAGSCLPNDEEPVRYCWENIRIRNTNVDVAIDSDGAFDTAFYEIAVAIDGSPNATWVDLGVRTPAGSFILGRQTIVADGEYRVYQIPLRALEMNYADLMGRVTAFRVGSQWLHGASVRLDEAYIRW